MLAKASAISLSSYPCVSFPSQLFEADIFNRQQILFSIISDGQRMVQEGELDDPDEFQHKLSQLSEQWQNVIRRAAQRKEIIDKNIR